MNNLNNIEKFDALVKSAALDYELPYNEDAWNVMQKKLDKKNGKKRGAFFFLILGFAVLLSTSAIVFNKYLNFNKVKNTNTQIATSEVEKNINDSNGSNKTSIISSVSSHKKNNIKDSNLPLNIENNGIAKSEITIKSGDSKKKLKQNVVIPNVLKQNESKLIVNSKNKKTVEPLLTTKEQVVKNKKDSVQIPTQTSNLDGSTGIVNLIKSSTNSKLQSIESIANKNEVNANKSSTLLMHNRYVFDFEKLALENKAAITTINKTMEDKVVAERVVAKEEAIKFLLNKKATESPASSLFITLAVANNIGYVSNPRIDQSSIQLNVGLGYNISKHVSFQTGIIFGKRELDVRKDQFSYSGPLIYQKNISNINAAVNVIDIPISIRYQFSEKENEGLFFTGGISSVFLKEENYRVNLSGISGIDYLDQKFTNTPSRFSMLNLSIGYQYYVNKYFNISVEPYLQLPFKNIGEGGTKLCSTGLQIGAKYSFIKKKSKYK